MSQKETKELSEKLKHCWHTSATQHAMINHVDTFCCFCNKSRCVNFARIPDPKHGKFAPASIIQMPPDDDECPERKEEAKS